jgi:hypothetical protein
MADPSEAPAAAPAPAAPAGPSDDDIIGDILGDKGKKPERVNASEEEPEGESAEGNEPPAEEEDPDEPADEEADEPAVDDAEDEPADGDIAKARALLADGDIDAAFLLAFGKKPEELLPNNHTWTQWRTANDREAKRRRSEEQAIQTQRHQLHEEARSERLKIHNTIEQLKPYEKFYIAEQSWKREGDPQHLVTILEGVAQMPFNEIQKIILTKTRRSPAERQLQERLQELEHKLAATTTEREQQAQQLTQQQQYAADLGHIRQNVAGEVTKIPKFAERIYNVILQTRSAVGNTLTVAEAADRVVKAERKRIANHPFVRKPQKKVPAQVSSAARTLASRGKPAGSPLRRNSQNNGASTSKDESTDDIVNDILKGKPRRAAV